MTAIDTIPVGSGLAAQLVAKDEGTYGVAADLSSGIDCFEFQNETLELKKTAVDSNALAAGHVYKRTKRRVLTNYDVNGAVNMDLPTRNLGFFLRYMIGDFTHAVTEISTTGVYKTIFQAVDNQVSHSFTLQKGVPATDATVEPFTYVGCKIASWEISCSVGAIAALVLNIDARNELAGSGNSDPLNVSVPTLATWAPVTTGLGMSVFHFREATLYTGGTPAINTGVVSLTSPDTASNVKDVTIQHAFNLDTNRVFLGSSGFKSEPIESDYRAITGSFTAEFLSSEALYDAYAADTTTSLELTFVGPIGGTSGANTEKLDILIPNIKLEGESPKVGGPAVVTQQINFTGYDDETTTPIQITYQSEDSTF